MLKKLGVEKTLLRREIFRRITKGQLIGKPQGDYVPVGFENIKAENLQQRR